MLKTFFATVVSTFISACCLAFMKVLESYFQGIWNGMPFLNENFFAYFKSIFRSSLIAAALANLLFLILLLIMNKSTDQRKNIIRLSLVAFLVLSSIGYLTFASIGWRLLLITAYSVLVGWVNGLIIVLLIRLSDKIDF